MRFFAPIFFAVLSDCCFFPIFSEVAAHIFREKQLHGHIPFSRLFSCQRTFRPWFPRRVHTPIFTRRVFQPSILDCWKITEKLTPTVKLFLGRLFSPPLVKRQKNNCFEPNIFLAFKKRHKKIPPAPQHKRDNMILQFSFKIEPNIKSTVWKQNRDSLLLFIQHSQMLQISNSPFRN